LQATGPVYSRYRQIAASLFRQLRVGGRYRGIEGGRKKRREAGRGWREVEEDGGGR
jgi:hypothetical protein